MRQYFEIDRFPAGTRADPQAFNEFTYQLATNQEQIIRELYARLDTIDRLQDMAVVQSWFPPIYWTSATVDPILHRGNMQSGNAQHDVRFMQIIQPIKSWVVRPAARTLVARPVAEGGPKLWDNVTVLPIVQGKTYDMDGEGVYNDAWVRIELPTIRSCNALVWEPFPAWMYELSEVRLYTTSGETTLDLTYCDTEHHGPQRFFFPMQECIAAEVKLKVFPGYKNDKIALGTWKFELAYATAQTGVSFTFRLTTGTITTAAAYGQGSWNLTINNPGLVDVVLNTPADAPTSVIRQFVWS